MKKFKILSDRNDCKRLYWVGVMFCMALFLINFTSALDSLGTFRQNEDIRITQVCSTATYINISSVAFPNSSTAVSNIKMTSAGSGEFYYDFINTSQLGRYDVRGISDECEKSFAYYFDVTPTGVKIQDEGQLSIGILYFFIILGFGFIFLGFLFLRNDSLWISYSGIVLMVLGFAFLYYDLHLSNLYASTIASSSGVGNVTLGAFKMVVSFLKLAPYFVAGLVAFAFVKVFRATIKKRNGKDGWDNNDY
jgi:hypothetical protein